MPKTLEAVTRDVLELSRAERLALAQIIFDLEGTPCEPTGAAEIRERLAAYDEGQTETISYEMFWEEMERRFGR